METDRLLLRGWVDADLMPFAEMNADPRVMRFFPARFSFADSADALRRIRAHFASHGFGLYVAEAKPSGTFAGFIGLNVPAFEAHFTPCVEIGWRLRPEFWNRGLATEGARRVLEHAFNDLALSDIVAFTTTANIPSRRVMEKLGMRYDPSEDFDHPNLPEGHPLRRHVLYRIRKEAAMQMINLDEKFSLFTEQWRPKIVAELNGQEVKIVKCQGVFPWHKHDTQDEMFLVWRGRFRIEFRDRLVELGPGELCVVPRGVEHRTASDKGAEVLVFEPAGVRNTGDVEDPLFTAPPNVKL